MPGYEGWTDNTDPVGAFDPYGNFYSLVLGYNFYYSKTGGHQYDNGSNQTNPTVPPETVAVSVRPHGSTGPNDWITKHNGKPDYVMTAKNANTSDPDKQWIAIDTNRTSPCFGTVYAMYTTFVLSPSYIFVSTATANADGTHTDWSTPQVLPTRSGKPWDSYLLPHIAPDGTVYTPVTNGNPKQGYSTLGHRPDLVERLRQDVARARCRSTQGIFLPTYQNTTFREGIVDTFGVGSHAVAPHTYPLYIAYEDGSSGLSNIWLTASYDRGASWTTPILVNDNASPVDELQPNLAVDAASGKVAVGFYDRRLPCENSPAAGSQYDPAAAAGASNYCINTAVQFYDASLHPLGHNVRASAHTWDPQLNAPHPGSIGGRDDVPRRLLRDRLDRNGDGDDVGLDLRLRRREPVALSAADRREGADSVAGVTGPGDAGARDLHPSLAVSQRPMAGRARCALPVACLQRDRVAAVAEAGRNQPVPRIGRARLPARRGSDACTS